MQIVLGAVERHSTQIAVHVLGSWSSVQSSSKPPFSRNTLFSPRGAGPSRGNKNSTELKRAWGDRWEWIQTAETILINSAQRRGFKSKNSLTYPALTQGRNVWLLMHLQLYQTFICPHFPCWKAPAEFMSFLHVCTGKPWMHCRTLEMCPSGPLLCSWP